MKVDAEWWVVFRSSDKSVVASDERARDAITSARQALQVNGPLVGMRVMKAKDARKEGVEV